MTSICPCVFVWVLQWSSTAIYIFEVMPCSLDCHLRLLSLMQNYHSEWAASETPFKLELLSLNILWCNKNITEKRTVKSCWPFFCGINMLVCAIFLACPELWAILALYLARLLFYKGCQFVYSNAQLLSWNKMMVIIPLTFLLNNDIVHISLRAYLGSFLFFLLSFF